MHTFYAVLMTQNKSKQIEFYQKALGLDVIFDSADATGMGREGQVHLIIREDDNEDSHHLAAQKGPVILCFQMPGSEAVFVEHMGQLGYRIRFILPKNEYGQTFVFAEDADENEICATFQE